jgi:hypothetical protein
MMEFIILFVTISATTIVLAIHGEKLKKRVSRLEKRFSSLEAKSIQRPARDPIRDFKIL